MMSRVIEIVPDPVGSIILECEEEPMDDDQLFEFKFNTNMDFEQKQESASISNEKGNLVDDSVYGNQTGTVIQGDFKTEESRMMVESHREDVGVTSDGNRRQQGDSNKKRLTKELPRQSRPGEKIMSGSPHDRQRRDHHAKVVSQLRLMKTIKDKLQRLGDEFQREFLFYCVKRKKTKLDSHIILGNGEPFRRLKAGKCVVDRGLIQGYFKEPLPVFTSDKSVQTLNVASCVSKPGTVEAFTQAGSSTGVIAGNVGTDIRNGFEPSSLINKITRAKSCGETVGATPVVTLTPAEFSRVVKPSSDVLNIQQSKTSQRLKHTNNSTSMSSRISKLSPKSRGSFTSETTECPQRSDSSTGSKASAATCSTPPQNGLLQQEASNDEEQTSSGTERTCVSYRIQECGSRNVGYRCNNSSGRREHPYSGTEGEADDSTAGNFTVDAQQANGQAQTVKRTFPNQRLESIFELDLPRIPGTSPTISEGDTDSGLTPGSKLKPCVPQDNNVAISSFLKVMQSKFSNKASVLPTAPVGSSNKSRNIKHKMLDPSSCSDVSVESSVNVLQTSDRIEDTSSVLTALQPRSSTENGPDKGSGEESSALNENPQHCTQSRPEPQRQRFVGEKLARSYCPKIQKKRDINAEKCAQRRLFNALKADIHRLKSEIRTEFVLYIAYQLQVKFQHVIFGNGAPLENWTAGEAIVPEDLFPRLEGAKSMNLPRDIPKSTNVSFLRALCPCVSPIKRHVEAPQLQFADEQGQPTRKRGPKSTIRAISTGKHRMVYHRLLKRILIRLHKLGDKFQQRFVFYQVRKHQKNAMMTVVGHGEPLADVLSGRCLLTADRLLHEKVLQPKFKPKEPRKHLGLPPKFTTERALNCIKSINSADHTLPGRAQRKKADSIKSINIADHTVPGTVSTCEQNAPAEIGSSVGKSMQGRPLPGRISTPETLHSEREESEKQAESRWPLEVSLNTLEGEAQTKRKECTGKPRFCCSKRKSVTPYNKAKRRKSMSTHRPRATNMDHPTLQSNKDHPHGPTDMDHPSKKTNMDHPPEPTNKDCPTTRRSNKDRPLGPTNKDRPLGPTNKNCPTTRQTNKHRPPGPTIKDRPPEPANRDSPLGPTDNDCSLGPINKDRPSTRRSNKDHPPGPINENCPGNSINKDRPPGPTNKDRPPGPTNDQPPNPHMNSSEKSVQHVTDVIDYVASGFGQLEPICYDPVCEATPAVVTSSQERQGPQHVAPRLIGGATDKYELEIFRLSSKSNTKKEAICRLCEKPIDLIQCKGACNATYHPVCLGLTEPHTEIFICAECSSGVHPCFICKEASDETRHCSAPRCKQYYHVQCLLKFNQNSASNSTTVCPQHACATCALSSLAKPLMSKAGLLYKCVRCPTAYHVGDLCIAAGCIRLAGLNIVCSKHFRPIKSQTHHAHINVDWCFVCSKGGTLLCCESCPAAFHADCLQIDLPSGKWYCADCCHGKRPRYGEIVWVKVGNYRWWPAEICLPQNVPQNIQNKVHQAGEFPVRFFGSYDYMWTHQGRVMLFQDGDRGSRETAGTSYRARLFNKAMSEALEAYPIWCAAIAKREKQEQEKYDQKPAPYKHVKVNVPIGSVVIRKVDVYEVPHCNCSPDDKDPCGVHSECLNQAMMYECHPVSCPAKERCQNQRFAKRLYPACQPSKVPGHGWGLEALEDIKKGSFIHEYVGDLVDEEECRRRIKDAHDNDLSNFYMLTLDKNRIIDAGPKGNLSRFMNHSCRPNCETQKWTVMGDVRVGLFAKHDIQKGSELTFNYNLECMGNEKKACHCGTINCSGFLGVLPKTMPDVTAIKKTKAKKRLNFKRVNKNHATNCVKTGITVHSNRVQQTENSVTKKHGKTSRGSSKYVHLAEKSATRNSAITDMDTFEKAPTILTQEEAIKLLVDTSSDEEFDGFT